MELKSVGVCSLLLLFVVNVHSFTVEVYRQRPFTGSEVCARGPAFWCKNLINAKDCNAVKHCIQTVWEQEVLPEDNDSVCKICKDMVAQARAQLESNETQEELRQVFEGSCKLIPLKVVSEECIKLADEFIPELVETLASQMNPNVVCTVAGLCNNARIDFLLENKQSDDSEEVSPDEASSPDKCEGCSTVARQMELKFKSTPKNSILNNMVEACGRLGSFSDGCSALIITHFDSLYEHLQKNLAGDGLCHLSGMCQYKFHTHNKDEIEIVHKGSVGVLKPVKKDDLPCDLCEQLVVHLRNILVANTTESEFEMVLKGLCKQFKSFKTQCLSIVDEYYAVIYDYLVNSLDAEGVCSMAGICPRPTVSQSPIWPLVPNDASEKYKTLKSERRDDRIIITDDRPIIGRDEANSYDRPIIGRDEANSYDRPIIGRDEANSYNVLHRISLGDKGVGVRASNTPVAAPLPLERMLPQTLTYSANKEICTFCEYFLHYLQVALTSPSTEVEIKKVVDEACDHLPHTIDDQCRSFVDTYGNALVALLAQEIDPSQVCPMLSLCPKSAVLIDMTHSVNDKPTCPLCLFAVEELITKLKNNKTEDEIRKALDNLCTDLPDSLVGECRTFVEDYAEELVDMLVADFTPQEVCTYLKLCDAPKISGSASEILTNEIPPLPEQRFMPQTIIRAELEKIDMYSGDSTSCVMCEFVLSKIDSMLKDKATEEEIKTAVHDVCNWMPNTILTECNKFVDQYADLIITVLAQSLDPKEVCSEIKLCKPQLQSFSASIEQCTVCDAALGALDKLLEDPSMEKDAAQALQKVCDMLPQQEQEKCKSIVKIYGPSILNLLARETPTHKICEKIGLCPRNRQVVELLGGKRCTWGPGYWCQSEEHAKACGATAHCQERVWKSDKPTA